MDTQLSSNTPRRTRQAQQEGGQNPVWERALALVQEGIGKVIEGALAAIAPVAFTPGAVVIRAPRINVVALAPGTLQRALFPPQCMNVGLTLFGIEELVDVREHWHR
jgi:hypothetical protein